MSRKTTGLARIGLSAIFIAVAIFLYTDKDTHAASTRPASSATSSEESESGGAASSSEAPAASESVSYAGCKLPILMYHNVVQDGESCNDMTVTASRLEEDLKWISEEGYHTVLPQELAEGKPLPEKPVLITFDDGYRSNYELAYPLLQKYQEKAVISLMVYMQDVGATQFLSWDMCREMEKSGLVEIGSHAYKLHNLDDRKGMFTPGGVNGVQRKPGESDQDFQTRVLDDIQKSDDRIEEELGHKATFFAYPFGIVEPDAEPLIDQLFPVTVVTKTGGADLTDGLQKMPRWTITMKTKLQKILP